MSQTDNQQVFETDFSVIDIHNHVFPDHIALRAAESIRDYYKLPMYGDGTLQTMLDRAGEFRVEHFFVCSAALKPEKVRTANEFTAIQRARSPRILSFGTTHAGVRDQIEVFRQIEAFGLSGVKLHPDFQGFAVDDERLDEAWRQAIRLKLPVLIHVGDPNSDLSSPSRVYRVMERFPELKIIAAHMGGYQVKEAAECLVGTHCYFDTSQWFYFLTEAEFLERIEKHGVEKILFGSDYPLNVADREIKRLLKTALPKEDRDAIFYRNAKNLFKL